MDKISISNLFPTSKDNKPLDVYSLYNTRDQKTKHKINLNIDRLINLREERRKKIFDHYEKIFNMCVNKINLANDLKKIQVVYDVPDGVFGTTEYNMYDCLEYIQQKLKEKHIDSFIISNKSIYISWENLEQNIKNDKLANKHKKHDDK